VRTLIEILRPGEGDFTGAIDDCEPWWVYKAGRTGARGTPERIQDPEIDYAARHLCDKLNMLNPRTLDRFQHEIHYYVD